MNLKYHSYFYSFKVRNNGKENHLVFNRKTNLVFIFYNVGNNNKFAYDYILFANLNIYSVVANPCSTRKP